MTLASAADHTKKEVKNHQRNTAGPPATGEFAGHHLTPGHRFGQQREYRPVFPLRRDLPRRRYDRNHQRRNPNQQQADLFQIPHYFGIIEKSDRRHYQRDERRQNKENVKILPPVKLLNHNAREGKDGIHAAVWPTVCP